MEEQIREVNAQIKETAKEVGQLFALETTDKARFESKLVHILEEERGKLKTGEASIDG